MPSSEFHLESEGTPQLVIAQFGHWLSSTAIHCAIGVVLGMLLARAMRSRHLHWSWAASALVLLLVCEPSLPGPASTLAVACLFAGARGRRWHREDLEAGADLTELADGRRTPLDLLRSLARAASERARETHGAGRRARGDETGARRGRERSDGVDPVRRP